MKVVCIDNAGYEASLVVGKLYEVLSDPVALQDEMLRIVDESGEDYLYESSRFAEQSQPWSNGYRSPPS